MAKLGLKSAFILSSVLQAELSEASKEDEMVRGIGKQY